MQIATTHAIKYFILYRSLSPLTINNCCCCTSYSLLVTHCMFSPGDPPNVPAILLFIHPQSIHPSIYPPLVNYTAFTCGRLDWKPFWGAYAVVVYFYIVIVQFYGELMSLHIVHQTRIIIIITVSRLVFD